MVRRALFIWLLLVTAASCTARTPITCTDGVQNGNETDSDCGGFCPACTEGSRCLVPDDCRSGVCDAGACLGTAGEACTDNDDCPEVCINDSCAVISGSDGPCDEPADCEVANTCDAGSCVLCSLLCDDSNPCTDDSCDATGGCQWFRNTAPCDDGDACTTPDTCTAGVCTGGPFDDVGCATLTLPIYRSAGVGSGAPLASGTSALAVAGTTAVFADALPDNVGVGDVIHYDSNGDSNRDALAFIHRRNAADVFSVRNAAGKTPTAATSTNDWSVSRAYLSLAAAVNTKTSPACAVCSPNLGGSENSQIGVDFDVLPGGGKDLVAANQEWNVACYADSVDDEMVHIDSPWTTDATHALRIFTPVATDEVGTSQRHDGTWGTGYQRTNALLIWDLDVWVDGLSIRQDRQLHSGIDATWYWRVFIAYVGSRPSVIRVSNSFAWMNSPSSANRAFDFFESLAGGVTATILVWNTIGRTISTSPTSTAFLNNTRNADVYFYNCTGVATANAAAFYNEGIGAHTVARNCLGHSALGTAFLVDAASSTFDCESCASNDATATAPAVVQNPGANWSDETFSFVDESGGNYHLAASDQGARARGLNLSADPVLAFDDDIDAENRPASPAPWCIGADE